MVESVLFLRKSRATTKAHRGIIFQFGVDPLNTILPINHGEIGKNQLAPLEQLGRLQRDLAERAADTYLRVGAGERLRLKSVRLTVTGEARTACIALGLALGMTVPEYQEWIVNEFHW